MSADLPSPALSAGARGSANAEAEPRAACNGSSGLVGVGGADPWEDGKSATEHLTDCLGCERCEWLMDGFYMTCDHCGHWGMQESDGWTLCRGMVFCNERCRDSYFGCDASGFSETEPIQSGGGGAEHGERNGAQQGGPSSPNDQALRPLGGRE
jgi:Tfp pilus tip-associated adhesin PilY1